MPPPVPGPPSPLGASPPYCCAAATRSTKSSQGGGDAVAAMRVERLGRKAAGGAGLEDALAARAEVAADDHGVRSRSSEPVVERLQDPVRIAARLVLGCERKDCDVHRACGRGVDFPSEPRLVGCADRELCRRVDVNRIRLQRSDGGVDSLARRGGSGQRKRHGQQRPRAAGSVSSPQSVPRPSSGAMNG